MKTIISTTTSKDKLNAHTVPSAAFNSYTDLCPTSRPTNTRKSKKKRQKQTYIGTQTPSTSHFLLCTNVCTLFESNEDEFARPRAHSSTRQRAAESRTWPKRASSGTRRPNRPEKKRANNGPNQYCNIAIVSSSFRANGKVLMQLSKVKIFGVVCKKRDAAKEKTHTHTQQTREMITRHFYSKF